MAASSANAIHIVPMTKETVIGWRSLWKMNVDDAVSKAAIDHAEKLMLEQRSNLFALLAVTDDQEVVGFLHGAVHPIAGSMGNGCYMQDLFVHPARRRQGIGTRLMNGLAAMGHAEKWDRVYWLTEKTNTISQALYKDAAATLDLNFHILPIGMLDQLETKQ